MTTENRKALEGIVQGHEYVIERANCEPLSNAVRNLVINHCNREILKAKLQLQQEVK